MIKKIKKISYREVELGLAILVFGILSVSLILEAFSPTIYNLPKGYIYSSLLPRFGEWFTIVVSFCFLNFYVFPKLWLKDKKISTLIFLILVFILNVAVFSFAKFSIEKWNAVSYGHKAATFLPALKFGLGFAIVYLSAYCCYVTLREHILKRTDKVKERDVHHGRIFRQIVIAVVAYVFTVFLTFLSGATIFFTVAPFVFQLLPFLIVVYFLSLYWLIPSYHKYKRLNVFGYILILFMILILLGRPFLSLLALQGYKSSAVAISGVCFLITIALSWLVYYSYEASDRILFQYKAAQAKSVADLESLRSQINPHFLFNTLNTLCGVAVTEGADLTHSGIQKLGEMMRFMLHENNLELIPVTSEIHYLKNYVDLQGLRISQSENFEIVVNLEEYEGALKIAPMLLIPLVENAYKHGVSYISKSFIHINLSIENNTLELEVRNSLHPHWISEMEEQRSGMGLENVRQRLDMLYGKKYKLVISSENEFLVKLTLKLS